MVGDAAGGNAVGAAGQQLALEGGDLGEDTAVILAADADEHAGLAAAQRHRVDAGALDALPDGLQEHPLLRVHAQRLARRDAEEGGVEAVDAVDEAALAGVALALRLRVGVVDAVGVPAAVGGEAADGVDLLRDDAPQVLGRGDAAGQAAGHADDGDRLVARAGGRESPDGVVGAEQFVPEVGDDGLRGGVVEADRGRNPQAGHRVQAVAQVHGSHGGQAEFGEVLLCAHGAGIGVAENHGELLAYELQQELVLFGVAERGELVDQLGRSAAQAGGPVLDDNGGRVGRAGSGRCPPAWGSRRSGPRGAADRWRR